MSLYERRERLAKMLRRYTIEHHTEEAVCGYCGCPLYVGDFAWMDRHGGPVVCSTQCGVNCEVRRLDICKEQNICPNHGDFLPCGKCQQQEARAAYVE